MMYLLRRRRTHNRKEVQIIEVKWCAMEWRGRRHRQSLRRILRSMTWPFWLARVNRTEDRDGTSAALAPAALLLGISMHAQALKHTCRRRTFLSGGVSIQHSVQQSLLDATRDDSNNWTTSGYKWILKYWGRLEGGGVGGGAIVKEFHSLPATIINFV